MTVNFMLTDFSRRVFETVHFKVFSGCIEQSGGGFRLSRFENHACLDEALARALSAIVDA